LREHAVLRRAAFLARTLNDGGNGAAAKKLKFQIPRHRRLPFTAWLAAAVVREMKTP